MVTIEKIKDVKPVPISTLRELIEILMKGTEELRGDDSLLVSNGWANFLVVGLSDACSMEEIQPMLETIDYCFQLAEMCNLPSYDSITRIRRDIQRKHPELQPSEPIKKLRKEKQERIRKMFENEKRRDEINAWYYKTGEQK